MNSKKVQPGSLPVFANSLAYHLKPRPIEADDEAKAKRKERRSRERSGRGFRVGGTPKPEPATTPGVDPKIQTRPEPVSGWITRAEARNVLGINEAELGALLARFRLRHNLVEVYPKAEILALRAIVEKLR
jgi:hypothetical protein